MNRFLLILFTIFTIIFSNEMRTTYARIIETETVSNYINFIRNEVVKRYSLSAIEILPMVDESSVKEQVTDKITLAAGDTGITDTTLREYFDIIKEITLPTLKSELNQVPVKNVDITLFTSPEYYGQALLRTGITSSDVTTIVKNSGGITINSSIWIPIYNLKGKGEISNALTHELTHVTLNQAGIASKIPLWLNEGTAWYTGLAAYESVDPFGAKVAAMVLSDSVQNLAQKGKRHPLDNTEQGLYYIEAQGYLATDALIKKYGLETFQEFLKQALNKEVNKTFDLTYKMSLDNYEKSFKP